MNISNLIFTQKQKQPEKQVQKILAALVYLIAKCDEYYDPLELAFFDYLNKKTKILDNFSKQDVLASITIADDLRKNKEMDNRLKYICDKIPPEYKHLAFYLSYKSMLADKRIVEEEKKILTIIKKHLNICDEHEQEIINYIYNEK